MSQHLLVRAAKGTVMPMVGRRGEWIQVKLSPEIRKTGMPMRRYKNETSGWMRTPRWSSTRPNRSRAVEEVT
jgi:hypothetical protein